MNAKTIRNAWIDAALAEHARTVDATTRKGEDIITDYFDRIGWRWAIAKAGGDRFTEGRRRSNSGLLEYCGIFWAAVGMDVGRHMPEPEILNSFLGWFLVSIGRVNLPPYKNLQIHPGVANYVLPSTYRIEHSGHWKDAGDVPEADRVTVQEMERGDLIIVATSGRKSYGDHFAGVVSVDRDRQTVETVEANAGGVLGDGSEGRGVVRRTRKFDEIRRIRRFDERHFLMGDD